MINVGVEPICLDVHFAMSNMVKFMDTSRKRNQRQRPKRRGVRNVEQAKKKPFYTIGVFSVFVIMVFIVGYFQAQADTYYELWQTQLEWHEQSTNVLISLEPENEYWQEQIEEIREDMDGESRLVLRK